MRKYEIIGIDLKKRTIREIIRARSKLDAWLQFKAKHPTCSVESIGIMFDL